MLNDKQTKEFLKFYKELYGDTKELPVIHITEEQFHEQLWRKFIRKMLGKQADELYKVRRYGPQLYGDKVFSGLRACYGPIAVNNPKIFKIKRWFRNLFK